MKILHGDLDLDEVKLLPIDRKEWLKDGLSDLRIYYTLQLTDDLMRTNWLGNPTIIRWFGILAQEFLQNKAWKYPLSFYLDREKILRVHPGASRVVVSRFLDVKKLHAIGVVYDQDVLSFKGMSLINKEQFAELYPDLKIQSVKNRNENQDIDWLQRTGQTILTKYDHFEILAKDKSMAGREFTNRANYSQMQHGVKALHSLSFNFPIYTNLKEVDLNSQVRWQTVPTIDNRTKVQSNRDYALQVAQTKVPIMDSYLNEYVYDVNNQDNFVHNEMHLHRYPLSESDQILQRHPIGCSLYLDIPEINYNPWEILLFAHPYYHELSTSCGKVRLINPQAKSHLKGILPDRYADHRYGGKRSQKPLAF